MSRRASFASFGSWFDALEDNDGSCNPDAQWHIVYLSDPKRDVYYGKWCVLLGSIALDFGTDDKPDPIEINEDVLLDTGTLLPFR